MRIRVYQLVMAVFLMSTIQFMTLNKVSASSNDIASYAAKFYGTPVQLPKDSTVRDIYGTSLTSLTSNYQEHRQISLK